MSAVCTWTARTRITNPRICVTRDARTCLPSALILEQTILCDARYHERVTAPVLLWFRQDLRVEDNPALHAAVAHGPVIPLYIWAPGEEGKWPPGAASRWWLHHSLTSLAAALDSRGSRLILRIGNAAQVLEDVIRETGATAVFWNRRYEPAALERDRLIEGRLALRAKTWNASLLFEPGTILNKSGRPFQVFTPFLRSCLEQTEPGEPLPAPLRIPAPSAWPKTRRLTELALLPTLDWADGIRAAWQPGEHGAQARLAEAQLRLTQYEEERNRPDHPGTSRLSPHLHFGEISARQVWRAARGYPVFRRQLIWREFAHHLLFHFPHTANAPLRPEWERFEWRNDAEGLRAWQRGRTGYPIVDAGMRELWRTGWMHNRVRMIVASFLVKHLRIHWEEGAYWFWDTLVDADLANNTLGWQWSAGCGADAAPYFRIFNPARQAAKFDPDGAYVRQWGPRDFPAPMVNHDAARRDALAAFHNLRHRRPRSQES